MIYRRLLSAAMVCVALFATSGTAKADIDFHDTFSVKFNFFNDCTGEFVLVEVDVHLYLTIVETSDGTIRLRQNLNARGWGVGEDSRAIYRFNDNFHFSETDPTGVAYSTTAKAHTRLIGLGMTPNERVVFNYKYEVDEFGVITEVDVFDVICQGD